MQISLKLRGPLKKYGPGAETFEYTVNANSCTVRQLIEIMNIPPSSVSFVTVGDKKAGLDTLLEGNEEVTVYPRVAGG